MFFRFICRFLEAFFQVLALMTLIFFVKTFPPIFWAFSGLSSDCCFPRLVVSWKPRGKAWQKPGRQPLLVAYMQDVGTRWIRWGVVWGMVKWWRWCRGLIYQVEISKEHGNFIPLKRSWRKSISKLKAVEGNDFFATTRFVTNLPWIHRAFAWDIGFPPDFLRVYSGLPTNGLRN